MPPNLCPTLLLSGTLSCSTSKCPFSHDLQQICFTCNRVLTCQHTDFEHLQSKFHQDAIECQRTESFCPICHIIVTAQVWQTHARTKAHKRNVTATGKTPASPVQQRIVPDGYEVSCNVCSKWFINQNALEGHSRGRKHLDRVKVHRLKTLVTNTANIQKGIAVSNVDGADGFHNSVTSPWGYQALTSSITITTNVAVTLLAACLHEANPFALHVALPVKFNRRVPLSIPVLFRPVTRCPAGHTTKVDFKFRTGTKQEFIISGTLRAPRDVDDLASTSVTIPALSPPPEVPSRLRSIKTLLTGPRSLFKSTIPYIKDLPVYPFDNAVVSEGPSAERLIALEALLPGSMKGEAYAAHWGTLIHAEEYQLMLDLRAYTMYDVELDKKPKSRLYLLDVPGLAEKRPSVLKGDCVNVALTRDPDTWYEGRVIDIENRNVVLSFHGDFKYHDSDTCEVRFTVNRIVIRRMHDAINTSSVHLERIFFPLASHLRDLTVSRLSRSTSMTPYDARIWTNPRQLQAVTAIVDLPAGSLPYIVFGPPGTGKTVTIVEAIRQLLANHPDACILACAPSNGAADIIAERLTELGAHCLFRLIAPSRAPNRLPASLTDFVYQDASKSFSVSSCEDLENYRVIVSTCASASIPDGIGMPVGHFTHIFIDEAGQCMEPELAVAVRKMADSRTNVILSGDPKQLGPVVRSRVAAQLGLGASLLDRLMATEIYNEETMGGITLTKLTKNWRSHGSILTFSNEQFYRGQLEVCGSPDIIDSLANSSVLNANAGEFRVIFEGIEGEESQKEQSPSYRNMDELSLVTAYVDELLNDSNVDRPVVESDIGIITPYNAQGYEIRQQLKKAGLKDIKVGSVEEFQGQEKRVILMSTVRSNPAKISHDLKHALGFLVNPRRLNVALTRAQALLIIVGNPRILGLDPLWRKLLNYIHANGGWRGLQPNWEVRWPEDGPCLATSAGAATARDEMDNLERQLRGIVISHVPALPIHEEDYDAEVRETLHDFVGRDELE